MSTQQTDRGPRVPPLALVLLALIGLFWGVNWPILKIGVQEVPPFVFRTLASLSAAAGLFAIAKFSGANLSIPKGQRRNLAIAAVLNLAGWNILMMYGVELMDSGRAAILAYTMPIWASITGYLMLGERLTFRSILALVAGLFGMSLLFFGDEQALTADPLGPILIVLAAMTWGLGTVMVKYFRFTMPITVMTAWQHLIGVIPVAIVALVWDIHNIADEVNTEAMLAVFYNMTVTGIFCYWAFFKVVSMVPVVISTVGTLMVPVLGVFFNALFYSVVPGWVDYAALSAVVAAIYLVTSGRR